MLDIVKVGFIAETSCDKVVTAIRSAFEKHHEVDKISVLSTLVDGLISPVLRIRKYLTSSE